MNKLNKGSELSLPKYNLNKFFKSLLENILNNIVEEYSKNESCLRGTLTQTKLDIKFIIDKFTGLLGKSNATNKLQEYYSLLNMKSKEEITKAIVHNKNWTYSANCWILKNHFSLSYYNSIELINNYNVILLVIIGYLVIKH